MVVLWCLVLLGFSSSRFRVHGQADTTDFVSIDCGLPGNYTYIDNTTHIPYTSDAKFIDSGTIHNISSENGKPSLPRQQLSLRSFPSGARNCYTLRPVAPNSKYLLRATFLHGNYDGQGPALPRKPVVFDLHLGVNLWMAVNISDASNVYSAEAMTVASGKYISVCLVNLGLGVPFISSLELRPLKNNLYPVVNASTTVVVVGRFNMGPTANVAVRFPDDRYDRIWEPFSQASWTEISTNSTVQNIANDLFGVPSAVMQTAVTPVNSTIMNISLTSADPTATYYCNFYFSELRLLSRNISRAFNIFLNTALFFGPFTPEYLFSDSVYATSPSRGYHQYDFTLVATRNSTLPPIINAMELFSGMQITDTATDVGDVDAIMAIKAQYQVKRNWMGDPCSPRAFAWDGLNCSYSVSAPPRISTLNLSSSGLTGEIASSFGSLLAITYLDLSYNNLTGTIPDLLADLPSLEILDLTGNRLNGSIPSHLLTKVQNGLLTLRTEGNPNLCSNGNSCDLKLKKKKRITAPIIVIISVVSISLLLVLVAVLILWRRRKQQGTSVRPQLRELEDGPLKLENRQFTYMELRSITNNFERALGKGGYGIVYHGCLEDGTQVAVKMRSQSSSQGDKEFLAEAMHLTRIHHRNLVSLVGYCKDQEYLALVYEFMSQGTLQEHLRGRTQSDRTLSWRERLRIALEASQGLEYLHEGCKPPLIHRDVKTSNILLSHGLEAKIADFGLSKAFPSDTQTHMSTAVVGTPGYVDPEYYSSYQISEKSDVYSFGVVILELITGKPPILAGPETVHIVHWVRERLARGNIEDVVDTTLQRAYDVNSVWKAADVALKCTAQASTQRPTMADVVAQLKESLELEAARDRSQNLITCSENLCTEASETSQNSAFEVEHVGSMSVVPCPSAR